MQSTVSCSNWKRWINVTNCQTFYNWVWYRWCKQWCTIYGIICIIIITFTSLDDCNAHVSTCCASSFTSSVSNSFVKCLTFGDWFNFCKSSRQNNYCVIGTWSNLMLMQVKMDPVASFYYWLLWGLANLVFRLEFPDFEFHDFQIGVLPNWHART